MQFQLRQYPLIIEIEGERGKDDGLKHYLGVWQHSVPPEIRPIKNPSNQKSVPPEIRPIRKHPEPISEMPSGLFISNASLPFYLYNHN